MPFVLLAAILAVGQLGRRQVELASASYADKKLVAVLLEAPAIAPVPPFSLPTSPPADVLPQPEQPAALPQVETGSPPAPALDPPSLNLSEPAPPASPTLRGHAAAEPENVCRPRPQLASADFREVQELSEEAFGRRLAEAALEQTADFVVYDDRYRSIRYPMGDVPAFYGVCSDVVVRAYRRLGIDLQALVQQTRTGSGERSIDHRRTETLRRLFARYGASLPPSENPDDYKPGDIVTYYRPANVRPRSRSHIAIVSHLRTESGRPMIIHNRGNGPELEDALFFDIITGHYRFRAEGLPTLTARSNSDGSSSRARPPASARSAMR